MLAHFPITDVMPIYGGRYLDHRIELFNGNTVDLKWNESESDDCHDEYGRWMPRPPKPGDVLIVTSDGSRLAVKPETAWKWTARGEP